MPSAQTWVEPGTTATPLSRWYPAGLGLLTTLQLVPFQCSVRVWKSPYQPTVQASVAENTATPFRYPELGLLTTLHLVPFQCSIRVLPLAYPTAQTSLAELVATACRELVLRVGLLTTLQLVPFQCSIQVQYPRLESSSPTAQTELAELAATALSW